MSLFHVFLCSLIAFLWAGNAVLQKSLLTEISAGLYNTIKLGCIWALVPFFPRPKVPFGQLFLLGAFFFGASLSLFCWGLSCGIEASFATLITQMAPFWTIFIAFFVLGSVPQKYKLLGIFIGFAGLIVILQPAQISFFNVGLIAVFGTSILYAYSNVMMSQLKDHIAPNLIIYAAALGSLPALGFGFLEVGPTAFFQELSQIKGIHLAIIMISGLIPTTGASIIWAQMLKLYHTYQVVPFTLLIPPMTLGLSAYLYDTPLEQSYFIGMGMILLGISFVQGIGASYFPKALR